MTHAPEFRSSRCLGLLAALGFAACGGSSDEGGGDSGNPGGTSGSSSGGAAGTSGSSSGGSGASGASGAGGKGGTGTGGTATGGTTTGGAMTGGSAGAASRWRRGNGTERRRRGRRGRGSEGRRRKRRWRRRRECETADDCMLVHRLLQLRGRSGGHDRAQLRSRLHSKPLLRACRSIADEVTCSFGRCVIDRSCDHAQATCNSNHPSRAPSGQVRSVNEDGCWGPCLPPTECRDVTELRRAAAMPCASSKSRKSASLRLRASPMRRAPRETTASVSERARRAASSAWKPTTRSTVRAPSAAEFGATLYVAMLTAPGSCRARGRLASRRLRSSDRAVSPPWRNADLFDEPRLELFVGDAVHLARDAHELSEVLRPAFGDGRRPG